jgi:hypothetical protein
MMSLTPSISTAKDAKNSFVILKITTQKKQSLARLISKFVKPDSVIRKHTPMVEKIFKANPHIKSWKKIPKKAKVKLYISKNFLDKEKLDKYLKEKRKLRRKRAKKKIKSKKEKHFNISSQIGLVSITGDNNQTLKMNLFKVGLKYTHKFGNNLKYIVGIGGVKFFDITSSEADESVETNSFLPELTLGVSKKMSTKFSTSLNYDLLNYFIVSQNSNDFIDISPKNVHRLSLRAYYILSPRFSVIGSIGYIAGEASGVDLSLGVSYFFGKRKSYSFALISYLSQLKTESGNESSNAFIGSFGYRF